MAEAWVATFKTELVDGRRFPGYEHAEHEICTGSASKTTSGYAKSSETLPPAGYEGLNIKTDNGQTLAGR